MPITVDYTSDIKRTIVLFFILDEQHRPAESLKQCILDAVKEREYCCSLAKVVRNFFPLFAVLIIEFVELRCFTFEVLLGDEVVIYDL